MTGITDPHNLQRFVDAQAPVMDRVFAELAAGAKRTHWMWFVFPQIAGLGSSAMAARYAIASRDEAQAYLAHSVLGSRLRRCTEAVLAVEGRSARTIFGTPDDAKFRSSLTLLEAAAPEEVLFPKALEKFFHGQRDGATVGKLDHPAGRPV